MLSISYWFYHIYIQIYVLTNSLEMNFVLPYGEFNVFIEIKVHIGLHSI